MGPKRLRPLFSYRFLAVFIPQYLEYPLLAPVLGVDVNEILVIPLSAAELIAKRLRLRRKRNQRKARLCREGEALRNAVFRLLRRYRRRVEIPLAVAVNVVARVQAAGLMRLAVYPNLYKIVVDKRPSAFPNE